MVLVLLCTGHDANKPFSSSHDSKAKIWSLESRTCVATHSHSDRPLWAVKWLPKTGRSELFALAGGDGSVSFYREAAG
jgi:superkiller protein 8